MGPPNGHKWTLLVVDRLCGRGDRRNGIVVPTRLLFAATVDVMDPRRWRLGIWSPVVHLVTEGCVARVTVKALRGVQTTWSIGSRVDVLLGGPAIIILVLLLLLCSQTLLLLLQPRRSVIGN